jgi:hypothetical protein
MIGGKNAWKQRVLGDIVVSLQWVNGEPAMILWPKVKRSNHAGAFVICLSAIHQYVHSNGYPNADYLIPKAEEACQVMALDVSTYSIRHVADAILESVEDLVRMPPERPKQWDVEFKPEGEGKIMVGGQTIWEGTL